MKAFVLALLLMATPLLAEETNIITLTITTTVTMVQTSPNAYIVVSNTPSTVITTNVLSGTQKLLSEIKRDEANIYNLTNGIPNTYTANSSKSSGMMIDNLKEIWEKYDIAVSNLTIKRLQLTKLVEKK